MVAFTDDPVRDAENYQIDLERSSKNFSNDFENSEWKRKDIDGDEIIDISERKYGCPMEEMDEDELIEILEALGIEADEARWNENTCWIEYR